MADDPKYPNPAMGGVVGRAQSGRAAQLDAAESAALTPSPPPAAAPAPSTPATPKAAESTSVMERARKLVGFKEGGPVTFTGPAKVHGSTAAPEYVLPADTVKAVGKKNLDYLRKDTHNPGNRVPGSAKHKPGSRGM